MKTYRIFINDLGPNQFTGLKDVRAISAATALLKLGCMTEIRRGNVEFIAGKGTDPNRYIALPLDREDLWPNESGRISKEALQFGVEEQ